MTSQLPTSPHTRIPPWTASRLPSLGGIVYALLTAASVSEKCMRIPAFVNSISFGPGTERLRQDTVGSAHIGGGARVRHLWGSTGNFCTRCIGRGGVGR